MKRAHWLFIFVGALLSLALACALPTDRATPTPPAGSVSLAERGTATATRPQTTPAPLAGTPAALNSQAFPAGNPFAPFTAPAANTTASVPAYPFTLTALANATTVQQLDAAQRDILARLGFVAIPQPYDTPAQLYRQASPALPRYVTADATIHALHVLASVAWQRAQQNTLAADLQALAPALVTTTYTQWQAAGDNAVKEAAWHNLAFFSVGAQLLDPTFAVPAGVETVVADELTLIRQAGGSYISPLFGEQIDYTAFRPGSDDPATRYRQAMTWLRRAAFPLDGDPGPARRHARQALLMVTALDRSQNLSRWERIARPTAFFQGSAGTWDVLDVTTAAQAVFGTVPGVAALGNQPRVDDFIATMQALPRPDTLTPAAATFRFLPAPTRPDDAIFHALTFNRVGAYTGSAGNDVPFTAVATAVGRVRALPRGLDVAAAFGADGARAFLQARGDANYDGYATQLDALQARYAGLDEATWTRTLAGGWLYALQPLLVPPPAGTPGGIPPFTHAPAWQDKQLNTWFGGWIGTRFETTPAPRPVEPAPPTLTATTGYVAPQPLLFSRLAALAAQLRAGLDNRSLLDEEMGEKLARMEQLLHDLQAIAERELRGEQLNDEDVTLTRAFGTTLADLTTFAPAEGTTPATPPTAAHVVDVYADATGGQMLQAALGEMWPLYVIIPTADGPTLAVGAAFSTYELKNPLGKRLTDAGWQQITERPDPAGWMNSFVGR